jgi:hypothetical protein
MASKPKQQAAPAPTPAPLQKPPDVNLTTTGYGNMGYQTPQNPQAMGSAQTGQGTNAPAWMSGNFAAPWWGQAAPDVGHSILQANPDMYGAYQGGSGGGVTQQASPQSSGITNEQLAMILAQQQRRNTGLWDSERRQWNPYGFEVRGLTGNDNGGNWWANG